MKFIIFCFMFELCTAKLLTLFLVHRYRNSYIKYQWWFLCHHLSRKALCIQHHLNTTTHQYVNEFVLLMAYCSKDFCQHSRRIQHLIGVTEWQNPVVCTYPEVTGNASRILDSVKGSMRIRQESKADGRSRNVKCYFCSRQCLFSPP